MAEAIDSALAQTYPNIEILVINDGSKDNGTTRNIALSYGEKIRYFEKENGGVASALNLGIKEMKGEYFSWLSHDDEYFANKIEKQIDLLSKLTDKKVVLYSDTEYIDENSEFISYFRCMHYLPDNFRPAFIKDGIINGCTLLVPRICFEICGVFDTKLKTTQDYDLWFRISKKFDFIHQPEILIRSRIHENQDTRKLQKTVLEESDNLHFYFIQNITKEEIKRFTRGNIAGYYIAFAIRMESSICLKARNAAINHAFESLFASGTLTNMVRNVFKLILFALFVGARKFFVCFFGLNSFSSIKKNIRRFLK